MDSDRCHERHAEGASQQESPTAYAARSGPFVSGNDLVFKGRTTRRDVLLAVLAILVLVGLRYLLAILG